MIRATEVCLPNSELGGNDFEGRIQEQCVSTFLNTWVRYNMNADRAKHRIRIAAHSGYPTE